MVRKSLRLDMPPRGRAAVAALNSGPAGGDAPGGWATAVVVGLPQRGYARVRFSDGTEQVGPTDGTVTAVGATVRVTVNGRGVITLITSPLIIPDGATLSASGSAGDLMLSNKKALDEASSNLDKARQELERRIKDVEGHLDDPVPTDRIIKGRTLLQGDLLADGTVGARHIVATEDLWAKIAAFARVTTEMLEAGDATIAGKAVVGTLEGNTLRGGRVEGGVFELLAGDKTQQSGGMDKVTWRQDPLVTGQIYSTSVVGPGTAASEWTVTAEVVADRSTRLDMTAVYRTPGGGAGRVTTAVELLGGQPQTVTMSMPAGTWADLTSSRAFLTGLKSVPAAVVTVSAVTRWSVATGGGLTISRQDGKPVIRFTDESGGVTTLTQDEIRYAADGIDTGARKQPWRYLVNPPTLVINWPPDSGNNNLAGHWGFLGCNTGNIDTNRGGIEIAGYWARPPIDGWYQVTTACGWYWATTQSSWAVASSVWRENQTAPLDQSDPAMTLPLIPGVTTRPVASGLVYLQAGVGVCPAWWQNTGAWKPNSGWSRFEMRLVSVN